MDDSDGRVEAASAPSGAPTAAQSGAASWMSDDGASLSAMMRLTVPTVAHVRLLHSIGNAGGQGSTYLGEFSPPGSPMCRVAVKILHPGAVASRFAHRRAASEGRILRSLGKPGHPHVVAYVGESTAVDRITGERTPCLLMEYIDGPTLRQAMRAAFAQPDGVAARATLLDRFREMLAGAEWLCHQGVVHRDYKPSNAVIGQRGTVIIDLGAAWCGVDTGLNDPGISMAPLMTWGYASPEHLRRLLRGERIRIGYASDVYSLSVILYEILAAGGRPFEEQATPAGQLQAQFPGAPITPTQRLRQPSGRDAQRMRSVPWPRPEPALEALVMCGLAGDAANRPATPEVLLRAFDAARARPNDAVVSVLDFHRSALRRRRRLAVGSAFMIGAVGLGAMAIAIGWRGGSTAPTAAASPLPTTRDLTRLIKLEFDAMNGRWSEADGGLRCDTPAGSVSALRTPYRPPREYNFVVEFTPLSPVGVVAQHFCADSVPAIWSMCGHDPSTWRFGPIEFWENEAKPPRAGSRYLPPGERHRAEVHVRDDVVSTWLDGVQVAVAPRTAEQAALNGNWSIGVDVLGVGAIGTVAFHSIEVVEVSGPGRFIRRLAPGDRSLPTMPRDAEVGTRQVSLTDLQPLVAQVGWSTLGVNREPVFGNPVMLDGAACDRFLGAHAPSSLLYEIPVGAVGFRAVGIRPQGAIGGPRMAGDMWRYVLDIDGGWVFRSQTLREEGGRVPIDIAIPRGSRTLELRVEPIDGSNGDHAIWARPVFIVADGPGGAHGS